jgi:hypothetical protein
MVNYDAARVNLQDINIMSSSNASTSPLPDENDDFSLPDDAVIIQYPSLDPTEILENPELDYDDDWCNSQVDKKTGAAIENLMGLYRHLAVCSFDFNTAIVRYRLQKGDLKQKDVLETLDKFYRDFPDILPVPGSFVDANCLKHMTSKLGLHDACKTKLEEFKELVNEAHESHQENGDSDDDGSGSESEPEEEEKESGPPKGAKGRGGRKKGKKANKAK